jgi:hypothetical protein
VQYYSVGKHSVEISYSEFRRMVETKGVNDLAISNDTITGKLLPAGIEDLAKERKKPDLPQTLEKRFEKKEPIFSTVRMADPDLVKLLEKEAINYRAIQENTCQPLLCWPCPLCC